MKYNSYVGLVQQEENTIEGGRKKRGEREKLGLHDEVTGNSYVERVPLL